MAMIRYLVLPDVHTLAWELKCRHFSKLAGVRACDATRPLAGASEFWIWMNSCRLGLRSAIDDDCMFNVMSSGMSKHSVSRGVLMAFFVEIRLGRSLCIPWELARPRKARSLGSNAAMNFFLRKYTIKLIKLRDIFTHFSFRINRSVRGLGPHKT